MPDLNDVVRHVILRIVVDQAGLAEELATAQAKLKALQNREREANKERVKDFDRVTEAVRRQTEAIERNRQASEAATRRSLADRLRLQSRDQPLLSRLFGNRQASASSNPFEPDPTFDPGGGAGGRARRSPFGGGGGGDTDWDSRGGGGRSSSLGPGPGGRWGYDSSSRRRGLPGDDRRQGVRLDLSPEAQHAAERAAERRAKSIRDTALHEATLRNLAAQTAVHIERAAKMAERRDRAVRQSQRRPGVIGPALRTVGLGTAAAVLTPTRLVTTAPRAFANADRSAEWAARQSAREVEKLGREANRAANPVRRIFQSIGQGAKTAGAPLRDLGARFGAFFKALDKHPTGGGSLFGGLMTAMDDFSNGLINHTKGLTRHMLSFRGVIVAVVVALGPLAAMLGAVGGAALGLIGNMANLSGVVFALPGIVGAAATAFAALAIAVQPLQNVFRQYRLAQREATSDTTKAKTSALDYRDAVLAEQQAHLAYNRSLQDQPRALLALTAARRQASRDIQDYRLALQKLKFDEEGASLGVESADQNLRRALADPTKNNLDRKVAYHEAEGARFDARDQKVAGQRLKEDSAEAFKKGVEGSDQVIDALRSVQDATLNTAQAYITWQRAILAKNKAQNVKDAGGEQAAALKAQIAALPPLTRKVAEAMLALADGPYKKLRETMSENLFGPLSKDTGKFGDVIKIIGSLLGPTSVAMGKLAHEALVLLTNPDWKNFFAQQGKASGRIIETLGKAALLAANGFRAVVEVSRPFTDFITGTVKDAAKSFDDFFNSTEKLSNGMTRGEQGRARLAGFLKMTKQTMNELKPVVRDLAVGLLGFLGALNNSEGANGGKSFITRINEGMQGMARTFRGLGEQARDPNSGFQKWLRNVGPLIKDVVHFLGQAAKFFGRLFSDQSNIKEAQRILGAIGNKLLPALADLFDKLSSSGAISKLVSGITKIVEAVNQITDDSTVSALGMFFSILEDVGGAWKWLSDVVDKFAALKGIMHGVATVMAFLAGAAMFARFTGILSLVSGIQKMLNFGRGSGGLFAGAKDRLLFRPPGESAARRDAERTGLPRTKFSTPQQRIEQRLDRIIWLLERCCGPGRGGIGGAGDRGGPIAPGGGLGGGGAVPDDRDERDPRDERDERDKRDKRDKRKAKDLPASRRRPKRRFGNFGGSRVSFNEVEDSTPIRQRPTSAPVVANRRARTTTAINDVTPIPHDLAPGSYEDGRNRATARGNDFYRSERFDRQAQNRGLIPEAREDDRRYEEEHTRNARPSAGRRSAAQRRRDQARHRYDRRNESLTEASTPPSTDYIRRGDTVSYGDLGQYGGAPQAGPRRRRTTTARPERRGTGGGVFGRMWSRFQDRRPDASGGLADDILGMDAGEPARPQRQPYTEEDRRGGLRRVSDQYPDADYTFSGTPEQNRRSRFGRRLDDRLPRQSSGGRRGGSRWFQSPTKRSGKVIKSWAGDVFRALRPGDDRGEMQIGPDNGRFLGIPLPGEGAAREREQARRRNPERNRVYKARKRLEPQGLPIPPELERQPSHPVSGIDPSDKPLPEERARSRDRRARAPIPPEPERYARNRTRPVTEPHLGNTRLPDMPSQMDPGEIKSEPGKSAGKGTRWLGRLFPQGDEGSIPLGRGEDEAERNRRKFAEQTRRDKSPAAPDDAHPERLRGSDYNRRFGFFRQFLGDRRGSNRRVEDRPPYDSTPPEGLPVDRRHSDRRIDASDRMEVKRQHKAMEELQNGPPQRRSFDRRESERPPYTYVDDRRRIREAGLDVPDERRWGDRRSSHEQVTRSRRLGFWNRFERYATHGDETNPRGYTRNETGQEDRRVLPRSGDEVTDRRTPKSHWFRRFFPGGNDEGSAGLGRGGDADPRMNVPDRVLRNRREADEGRAYQEEARRQRGTEGEHNSPRRRSSLFNRGRDNDTGYATVPTNGRFLGLPLPGDTAREQREDPRAARTTPTRRQRLGQAFDDFALASNGGPLPSGVEPELLPQERSRRGRGTRLRERFSRSRPRRGRKGRGLLGSLLGGLTEAGGALAGTGTPGPDGLTGTTGIAGGGDLDQQSAQGGAATTDPISALTDALSDLDLGGGGDEEEEHPRRRGDGDDEDEHEGRHRRGDTPDEERPQSRRERRQSRRAARGRGARGGGRGLSRLLGGRGLGGVARGLGGAARGLGRAGGLLARGAGGLGRLAGGPLGVVAGMAAGFVGDYAVNKYVKNDEDAASLSRGLGAVTTGASIGGMVGSIIPGVGTVVGGAVGGAIGGAYSLVKDKNLRKFVGGKISGAAKSVGHFFGNMFGGGDDEDADGGGRSGKSKTSIGDRLKRGLEGFALGGPIGAILSQFDFGKRILDSINKAAGKIGGFFTKTIPDFFSRGVKGISDFFTKTLPGLPGKAFDAITTGFGVLIGFFLFRLPRITATFFLKTLPHAAASAWRFVKKNLWEPFVDFVHSIPGFITKTIPRWFHSARHWYNEHVRQPIIEFVSKTIPHFFTVTIPKWFHEAPKWFKTHVREPVIDFFTVKIPEFFTKTLPDAISKLPGFLYNNLVQPVLDFFHGIAGHVGDFLKGSWDWAKGLFQRGAANVEKGAESQKMSGGLIEGIYQGVEDKARLLATPGEFVVRRSATQQPYGKEFLRDFNEGRFDPADWYAGLSAAASPQVMSVVPADAPGFGKGSPSVVNHTVNSGLSMGDITINNPVREKSEHSLRRQIQVAAIRHRL